MDFSPSRSNLSFWPVLSGHNSRVVVLGAVAAVTLSAWWTFLYVRSPLRTYPGPLLAREYSVPAKLGSAYMFTGWTNLWRFFLARRGRYADTVKKLHEKHGPVVRLGPNMLDLDIPELIRTIYAVDDRWTKVSVSQRRQAVYREF